MSKKTGVWNGIASIFILILLGLSMFIYNKTFNDIDFQVKSATILNKNIELQPFSLIDNKGNKFSKYNLLNNWSIMFFGFTSCGGVCPKIMEDLVTIKSLLNDSKNLQYIMISLDPSNDSYQEMNKYVTSFHKDFIGLSGEEEQIKSLATELHISYMKINLEDKINYEIDHSGIVLLINPKGRLYAIFSMPHNANDMAEDLKNITNL